ncbi:hypothetical protein [Candidatus Paracaedibacter symbiosus]|uniref:hypothetical protein n=1 Tax=Candidatus Paracaedibacter symbiosus TaxID=244582 RepID=UPI0018DBD50E|nr:hypothetical protein [Candidatus Paracaedibacter symbiosus]
MSDSPTNDRGCLENQLKQVNQTNITELMAVAGYNGEKPKFLLHNIVRLSVLSLTLF